MVILGLKKVFYPSVINPKKYFQSLDLYKDLLKTCKKLPENEVNFIKINFLEVEKENQKRI